VLLSAALGQVTQLLLRITSFRKPKDEGFEPKTLETAMLVSDMPLGTSPDDVQSDSFFACSKKDEPRAQPRCDASLALAVDDMTGIIRSRAGGNDDAWVKKDQACKRRFLHLL
jgi:hypothetical protein